MDVKMKDEQKTSKIILDTNLMYYLCGLSTPPCNVNVSKISEYIRKNSRVYSFAISSVSFYELITHYQNRAGYIRRVCSTMRNYHVQIYNDKYLPIMQNPTYDFTEIRQRQLKEMNTIFMERKIDVESRFAAVVFMIVLISDIAFEVFPDGIFNSNTILLLSSIAAINQKVAVDHLNAIYKTAYTLNNPEGFIRDEFQSLLAKLLAPSLSLCKELSGMKEDDEISECIGKISTQKWYGTSTQSERKIAKRKTSTDYISRRARQFGKQIGDKQLTDFFSHMWDTVSNVNIEYDSIKEYVFEISKDILLKGSSFRKNDVNDSMILGSITTEDSLITCDKKILNHMRAYKETHPEYTNSLLLMQDFMI